MRCRVTVVVLCVSVYVHVSVCLSATTLAAIYLVWKSKVQCYTVLFGVANV